MTFQKELRLTHADTFDSYLELISQHLGFGSNTAVPDGIGDLACDEGFVSYAISRKDRFAAFRWLALAERNPAILESFMVASASKGCRSALLRRLLPQAGVPEGEVLVSARLQSLLDSWRNTVAGETAQDESSPPGFMELAAVLASRGRVQVTNAELLQKSRSIQSELDYARLELAEMAGELETAQANIRSTASLFGNGMNLDALLNSAAQRPLLPARPPATGDRNALDTPGTSDTSVSSGPDADANADAVAGSEPPDAALLDSLPGWAADNAHRIVVLPRALSGAKKSQYQYPANIMKALELLAGPYRQHRCGEIGLEAFDAALAASGLQLAGSVGPSIAGTTGEQYFVHWAKRKRFMDLHLLKGGGREARYCLRVYFFWDSDSRRCIVGSLPAHLSNSLS